MQRCMNCSTTKLSPEKMVEEKTFYKTKRFFHTAFRNVKAFVLGGYHRNPFANPISHGSDTIGPKLQKLDNLTRSFSQKPELVDKKEGGLLRPKGQTKGDERYIQSSHHRGIVYSKEEKKASEYPAGKHEEPCFLATENFAQKMEELEMMDVNNGQDIEEVIHHYSLLTSPAYLEIVDNFFTDMYSQLYLPQPSRSVNRSMRKLGSSSIHSSMRKRDSATIHGSMRKLCSARIHGSMREIGSASAHRSMRKIGSASAHSSMRNLAPLKQ